MESLRAKKGFICDMDGVIYHGNQILPGVKEFVEWLYRENKNFLFLTNSSERSPKELQQKLSRMGITSPSYVALSLPSAFFTMVTTLPFSSVVKPLEPIPGI